MGGNEPSETERLVIHHEVDQKLGESSDVAPKSGMDYKFFSTALLGMHDIIPHFESLNSSPF